MGSQQQHDMYYDGHPSGRSPGSRRHQHQGQNAHQQNHHSHTQQPQHQNQQQQQQHQTLHRTPSRHFDPFATMPTGLYTAEDHAAVRYDTNRFDRMPPPFQPGYGYDMVAAQTWNAGNFNGNLNGGGNGNLNGNMAMGATGRVKPSSRQRTALPPVSHPLTRKAPY